MEGPNSTKVIDIPTPVSLRFRPKYVVRGSVTIVTNRGCWVSTSLPLGMGPFRVTWPCRRNYHIWVRTGPGPPSCLLRWSSPPRSVPSLQSLPELLSSGPDSDPSPIYPFRIPILPQGPHPHPHPRSVSLLDHFYLSTFLVHTLLLIPLVDERTSLIFRNT